jgi:hypothetical protein
MSEIQVNTINEYTGANGVTIDGLTIKDGAITAGNPITEADIWVLTSNFTGDATPIASNLSRYTNDGAGYIGTGMTQSSGVFTFPSTGIWKIDFQHTFYAGNGYDVRQVVTTIATTTDNSSYSAASLVLGSNTDGAQAGDHFATNNASFLFDVTDTTTHKVRFEVTSSNTSRNINYGTSDPLRTGFFFTRLGDT